MRPGDPLPWVQEISCDRAVLGHSGGGDICDFQGAAVGSAADGISGFLRRWEYERYSTGFRPAG